MSKKYKFTGNDKFYFVTFTVTDCPPDYAIQVGVDLFIRDEYREMVRVC